MSTILLSPPLPLRLRIATQGGTCTVQLHGELDISNEHLVHDLAGVVVATGAVAVVLDLSGLRFVDVAGWRAVWRLTSLLEARGIRCDHHGPSPAFDRVDQALRAADRKVAVSA